MSTDRIVSAMSLTKRMSYLLPTVASQNQNRFVELQSWEKNLENCIARELLAFFSSPSKLKVCHNPTYYIQRSSNICIHKKAPKWLQYVWPMHAYFPHKNCLSSSTVLSQRKKLKQPIWGRLNKMPERTTRFRDAWFCPPTLSVPSLLLSAIAPFHIP